MSTEETIMSRTEGQYKNNRESTKTYLENNGEGLDPAGRKTKHVICCPRLGVLTSVGGECNQ